MGHQMGKIAGTRFEDAKENHLRIEGHRDIL